MGLSTTASHRRNGDAGPPPPPVVELPYNVGLYTDLNQKEVLDDHEW
jgi:hypothetical protein